MGNPLRDPRSPLELASSNQVIDFKEEIKGFGRLVEALRADLEQLDGATRPRDWGARPVTGQLKFAYPAAQSGRATASGHVAATVDLVCQRCLEPMQMELAADVAVVFGEGSEVPGFEVWEAGDDRLTALDLVDELLVMALPLVAKHAEDCVSLEALAPDDGNSETREDEDLQRPFADLKQRLRDKR